jgi:hypothetical protein
MNFTNLHRADPGKNEAWGERGEKDKCGFCDSRVPCTKYIYFRVNRSDGWLGERYVFVCETCVLAYRLTRLCNRLIFVFALVSLGYWFAPKYGYLGTLVFALTWLLGCYLLLRRIWNLSTKQRAIVHFVKPLSGYGQGSYPGEWRYKN